MGKADEDLQPKIADGPAPPPYTETVQASNAQAGTSAEASVAGARSAYTPFPQTMGAYYQWKMTMTFHLGTSADERLYAVSTHPAWKNKAPGFVLHNGASNKDPMLAAAGEEPGWSVSSPTSIITLPPPPGSPGERCTEIMRTVVSGKTVSFRFSIEVAHRGGSMREDFAWHRCKGDEAKKLVDGNFECLFKLTRVGGQAVHSGEKGAKAPDDEEILVMFAKNRSWSMTHPFRLQFEGSGKRGEMGERWELMVIITALRLWWLKQQGRVDPSSVAPAEADMVPGSKR